MFQNNYGQTDSLSKRDTLSIQGSLISTDTIVRTDFSPSLNQTEPRNTQIYKLKPAIDIPLTLAAAGWSIYGFKEIYSKEGSTDAQILSLDINDVNGFDRWTADVYNEDAAKTSDLLFYGSIPLPLLLLLDNDIRKDGFKVMFLYLEAMSITGVFYTGSAFLVDRYRPLAYNSSAPMDRRRDGNSKNSFLGGHPALVATSTFFIAKVFSDYHPDSNLKYVFYGAAIAATGTTAYLRYRAGRHFPSDLITGIAVGTLSGILVPHFHKNKLLKNPNLSITPFTGRSHGISMVYKL